MECLKCGKETKENQVFCSECKQIMEQYPVKPGTPIQLPKRAAPTQEKKVSHKKTQSLEQRIARQQLWLKRLCLVILGLVLTVGVLLFLLLK